MMNKKVKWLLIPVITLCISALFIFSGQKKEISDEEYSIARSNQIKVYALDLPDKLTFAGEEVPMDVFWVREAYDREILTNTYWHSSTFLMLKRTTRYFPVIEPILKKNGIPDDFKYLALAESNFTNSVSPAGATGFWQFLKGTGKEYGLEVTEEVDERYHLEKATEAACKYFLEAYRKFGNWTLAAAAYNAGMDNIAKPAAMQKGTSYYELLLNQETTRYIFRILAIREICSDPENYGFYLRDKDYYPPVPLNDLVIDTSIHDLATFALSKGINYKILKEFNPWLRKNTLLKKAHKSYTIKIPDPENIFYSKISGTNGKQEQNK
ncbi:MAG: lytic transglycosylase domain-containing protein [Bacteroidales bacterium]